MWKGESIGKYTRTSAKRIKKTHGLRPWEGKWEGRSRAPPYNPLGGAFSFLIGRNGHDGSANASPDPLLLAPDLFSWAYRTFDTTEPGQLLNLFIFKGVWGEAPMAFFFCNCPGSEFEMILAHRMDYLCGKRKA